LGRRAARKNQKGVHSKLTDGGFRAEKLRQKGCMVGHEKREVVKSTGESHVVEKVKKQTKGSWRRGNCRTWGEGRAGKKFGMKEVARKKGEK